VQDSTGLPESCPRAYTRPHPAHVETQHEKRERCYSPPHMLDKVRSSLLRRLMATAAWAEVGAT
jgi:hypothetical protein